MALATSFHAVTREQVIRRYLTLHVGDVCSEVQRGESERILRAQPYLADAHVVAAPDSQGGVVLDVTTVDEVSLIVDGDAATKAPMLRGLRLGEANLAGEGVYALGAWEHGLYRDTYRGHVVDYQFLGSPYRLSLQGARNELRGSWDAEFSYPFLTMLQRNAWRADAGSMDGYLGFLRPGLPTVALRFVRAYGELGGVHAFGPLNGRILLGGSFTRERERTDYPPVILADSAIVPDTSQTLAGRYGEHRTNRVNLLLGFRNMQFMTVNGFDALEADQDVRRGVQVAGVLGKGVRIEPLDELDYFVSGDLYVGGGTPRSFGALEVMGERRRDTGAHGWDGILGSGRAAWYRQPTLRHTFLADLELSEGSRQRVPFQLTFANLDGGLRGYGASRLAGGERLVMRLEDRHRLGRVRQFAGVAGAVFLDAGKLWAGDVPFGQTTGIKYSAGVSLLAALPPTSRRTWRIDLAAPLNDRHDAKFEVRVSNEDLTRWFWREPKDVQTSRERAIPNSVYNWL